VTVVATCQLALAIGDLKGNAARVADAVGQAAADGAELIVLPELCDTGYVFSGVDEARALASTAASSPALRAWRALSATHGAVIAAAGSHQRRVRPCRARDKAVSARNDLMADRRPASTRAWSQAMRRYIPPEEP
jgi:predicted amidohydrolase